MHPKSIKNDLKKGLVFRGGKVSKITKIRGIFKMGPQASKMRPRASKITQNHENMVTQNQENPRKKTSRNGTVAGYARSALDIVKYHKPRKQTLQRWECYLVYYSILTKRCNILADLLGAAKTLQSQLHIP